MGGVHQSFDAELFGFTIHPLLLLLLLLLWLLPTKNWVKRKTIHMLA